MNREHKPDEIPATPGDVIEGGLPWNPGPTTAHTINWFRNPDSPQLAHAAELLKQYRNTEEQILKGLAVPSKHLDGHIK